MSSHKVTNHPNSIQKTKNSSVISCIIKLVFVLCSCAAFINIGNGKDFVVPLRRVKVNLTFPKNPFFHHTTQHAPQKFYILATTSVSFISTVKYFIFNNQTFPIITSGSMVDHLYKFYVSPRKYASLFNLAVIILIQISLFICFYIQVSFYYYCYVLCLTNHLHQTSHAKLTKNLRNFSQFLFFYESTTILQSNVVCRRAMSNHAFLAFTFLLAWLERETLMWLWSTLSSAKPNTLWTD